jgi:hypothetical protein
MTKENKVWERFQGFKEWIKDQKVKKEMYR